jgi:hypothetical protein
MVDHCGYTKHFRVEDIADRSGKTRGTHRPKPASWEELAGLDNEAADLLRDWSLKFGYTVA